VITILFLIEASLSSRKIRKDRERLGYFFQYQRVLIINWTGGISNNTILYHTRSWLQNE